MGSAGRAGPLLLVTWFFAHSMCREPVVVLCLSIVKTLDLLK